MDMTTVYFKASAFRVILLISTLQIIYTVVRVESATCRTQPCLYFSHSKSLQSVEISSSKVYSVLPSLKNVVAVDVDVRQNLLFWSETLPNAIKMLNITNGKVTNVLSADNLGEIEGLAVEWEGGLIYWTDYTNHRIEVARLDGNNRKIVIAKGVRNPRRIVVDPRSGYMFWTSWGTRPRIQRASLSGDNEITLVDSFNPWHILPSGITLDFTENRLYWVDAHRRLIESIDFNGNTRRHLLPLPSNLQPYDILLYGGVFYLSVWGSSFIERISKTNGVRLPTYTGLGDGKVLALTMFSESRQPPGNTSCHNKNLCSHLCLLSPNGHQCACPTRTMLNADARTCDNNEISKFLLFVDEFQEAIYQFPLETKHPSTKELPLALDDVQNPIAVDYDPVESRLYWSDDDRGAIFRAQLNGTWQEQIVGKLMKPESIAVDSIGRNLYWTDSRRNRIEVSKLDGSFRKTLVYRDLDEPAGIILDVENGYMYWCQKGIGFFARIERANMDGTSRIVIRHFLFNVSPKRLALDRDHNRLYFVDERSKAIKFVTLGTNVTTIVTIVMRSGTPTGIAVHGNYIYWTERLGQGGSVYKADAGSGGNIARIADGFQGPEDICVFGGNEAIRSVNSSCKSNNGGCSHLCLLTALGHRCACPNEMTLKADMKTCHFSEFLLYADSGTKRIFKVNLDDPQTPPVALNLRNTQSPTALDFDPLESMIYWSDVQLDQISRSHPSGDAFQVVASNLQSPRGIAVDFVARNLYWTDYLYNKIEVSKLNGSYRKVLISQNLQSPIDIVLDMENGLMYWSCWALRPRIERASMNGSNRTTIINLYHVWGQPSRPSGLALDPSTSRLYWVDSSARRIQYTDLKRGDGAAVSVSVASRYLWQPYGLTLKENRLIWSDSASGMIYSADKDSGGHVKQIASNVMLAKDVHAYHNFTALPDDHPCALVNGWCTHLCLLVPGGYTCACPNSVASGIPCRTSPVQQHQSSTVGFRSKAPETSTALPKISPSSRSPSLTPKSSLTSQSSLSSTKASNLSPTESSTTYPFSSSPTSSGPFSISLSTSVPIIPSVPSFSKISMEASHSASTPTSSSVPTSAPKNACIPNLCRNGGKCVVGDQGQLSCLCPVAYTASFCEVLIGNNSVTITFRMVSDQWEEDTFKESIAKAFTDVHQEKQWSFQARDAVHYKRRSAVSVNFKPSDVLVLSHVESHPSQLDVVTAVLVPSKDRSATRKAIPADTLCKMVKEAATDISKYMGDHDVAFINGESDPPCGASVSEIKETEKPPSKSLSASKVAGIVVGILLLVITLLVALYCFRLRPQQLNVPWNQMERRDTISSSNNPGFTPAVPEPGDPDVDGLPFAVSDYEELTPAFARNSPQTEVGSMSSAAEVPVYAVVGPSTSLAQAKEIPTRNGKNINPLLPNVETRKRAQRATPLPSDLNNDIGIRGNSSLRQVNQTLMVNPTYEHVAPFGTSRLLTNCNAMEEGSRNSAMEAEAEAEKDDSEYSRLGGRQSTRQLDNESASPQYAKPFIRNPKDHSAGASSETKGQYTFLRSRKVSASNELIPLHGYAQLGCPRKGKHRFTSSTVLRSPSQVHPTGEGPTACTPEESEAGMRTTTGTSEGYGDYTRLDVRAVEAGRRQLQQQLDNESYDHIQNVSCTPGGVPVLLLERNGDTQVDETGV